MNKNITYLLHDALNENNYINENKYDDLDEGLNYNLIIYNFSTDKNDLFNYLEYKQNKLYHLLNKNYYFLHHKDIFEVLNDIYFFKYNFIKDINNINYDDNFFYQFNEIAKNINYEYYMNKKNIKYLC